MAMTIHSFLLLVTALLAGIYLFFRPMEVERPDDRELAQLDLRAFTVYELDKNGLIRMMYGDNGQRYKDRYEVRDISYTDSSNALTQDMTADYGTYRDEEMELKGNVIIRRSDATDVMSEFVSYDKSKNIVRSDGPFVMLRPDTRIDGEGLVYNMAEGHATAKKMTVNYTIPEQGKR